MRVRSRLPVLGVLIGAGVFPVLLLSVAGTRMVMFIPVVHIIVVGTAGLAAGGAASAVARYGGVGAGRRGAPGHPTGVWLCPTERFRAESTD